jgi:recombination protein RecT
MKDQIAMAAPRHLSADRIIRIVMTSIQRTPKLAECTPESILGALLTCTQLGLEPDSASGRAYLVPYGKVATLIIGYRGLMDLARRSGDVTSIEARVVHEKDKYEFRYGTQADITHQPCRDADAGDIVAAYGVAHLRNSDRPAIEWMWRKEIDAIRARSRAANNGPWVTDFSMMARKTLIIRLCRYLPSCAELHTAVRLDEQAEIGARQDIEVCVVPPSEPAGSLDDVVDRSRQVDDLKRGRNENGEEAGKEVSDGTTTDM